MMSLLQQYVRDPILLLLFIPFFVLFFMVLIKKTKALHDVSAHEFKKIRRRRTLIFFLRGLIFLCLFIALASPYLSSISNVSGDPQVTILVDNSSSFDVFDRNVGITIQEQLGKYIKTDLAYIGGGTESPLGDAASSYTEKGGALLFISDGQTTTGTSLEDASFIARDVNATFNALLVEPLENDYGITIEGPSKITAGVEAFYTVTVKGTDSNSKRVKVYLDGSPIFEKALRGKDSFIRSFDNPGHHMIRAELEEVDFFSENNVFYKSVKVIPKPTVTYLGKEESPLLGLVHDVYDTADGEINDALEKSNALIINDLPISNLEGMTQKLKNYVLGGNGLVVFGGRDSFEYGGYKDSDFEKLLPVKIGSAEKSGEDTSVVIAIDISGSSGETIDTAKSIAWSIVQDIKRDHFLGVIAFDTNSYTVLEMDRLMNVDRIGLERDIANLLPKGGTSIGDGIQGALSLLASGKGGKNIILITDGQTQQRDNALAAASTAGSSGAKLFVVGVEGDDPLQSILNEPLLLQLAELGRGSYFEAYEGYKLRILFGDPDTTKKDSYGIFLLDEHHFITKDLNIGANVYGFNEAVPRSSALLLVVTDTGEPLIAVWRYGLGRVAVVLSDDGTLYGGELLSKINSRLLVRTLNWAVGDPERKFEQYLTISDSYVGEMAEVSAKGNKPTLQGASFTEVERGIYNGQFLVNEPGFFTTLGVLHAVNSPREYHAIGVSPLLRNVVASTNGVLFEEIDVSKMADAFRKQSFRDVIEQDNSSWVFVLLSLVFFLLEIGLRRYWNQGNL